MSAQGWLDRAERALASATVLVSANDVEGACSSAYYAIFYAARAALFHVGQPERALGKTHSGTIAGFHRFLVVPGLIDARHGRAFQNEFSRRLVADYQLDGVSDEAASDAIDAARNFVAAVRGVVEGG